MRFARAVLLPLIIILAPTGCPSASTSTSTSAPAAEEARVVVYCALDREFAEPILERFSKETGIRADAKWDSEATKTTGLIQALIAERSRPRADVLWSNEAAQAAVVAKEGLLAKSELCPDAKVRDPEGRWVGFGARARVLVIHEKAVAEKDRPRSIDDLTLKRFQGRTGVANPLFGTMATHVAALVAVDGEEKTRAWLRALKANDVAICAGNADVKERVASGELAFGLTDTDDVNLAMLDQKPIVAVFPDQDASARGTLVVPNALGIVQGAPRPKNAERLAKFLLTASIEEELARGRSAQIPLLPGARVRPAWIPEGLHAMTTDWPKVADGFSRARELVKSELLKE